MFKRYWIYFSRQSTEAVNDSRSQLARKLTKYWLRQMGNVRGLKKFKEKFAIQKRKRVLRKIGNVIVLVLGKVSR